MSNQTLTQFRNEVYRALPRRADATMDLIDALAANTTARSVVELSLSPWFRRQHASVHDAIDALQGTRGDGRIDGPRRQLEGRLRKGIASLLPIPSLRPFWLLALDGLMLARPHARTLTDRGYVHSAEPSGKGAPVAVGHAYSLVVALPEREAGEPHWAPILSSRRVPTERSAAQIGMEQLSDMMAVNDAPWAGRLAVCVADSGYGTAPFLSDLGAVPNLVVVARLRSTRVLYGQPLPQPGKRGRRPRYGPRFELTCRSTWPLPAREVQLPRQTHQGKAYTLTVSAWQDMLMKGYKPYPMHLHPFTLLRVTSHDEAGQPYMPTMWLAVVGARRGEVDLEAAVDAYRQRFDQEHVHRFLRQHLLVDAFATPETRHEETWLQLVPLAYAELFAARHIAEHLPRPWEKRRPAGTVASPTLVQRDFDRILAACGTPAAPPKPRGIAPGRSKGTTPGCRKLCPVVFKHQSSHHRARAPAA